MVKSGLPLNHLQRRSRRRHQLRHSRRREVDRYDVLANRAIVKNRSMPETLLKDELLFQRATQTCLWALPMA